MPLRLGGALPHPLTASVLMLFSVALINPDSGHRLRHLTFLLLRLCAHQPTTNFSLKLLHSLTTYYTHFSHHYPPHHNVTALDGVHTLFSSLDTPHISLIAISLPVCYTKTAISFHSLCFVCIQFIVYCLA